MIHLYAHTHKSILFITDKYLSKALIQMHQLTYNMMTDCSLNYVQYMKIPSSEHVENMLCTKIVLNVKTKTKNNLCTHHVLPMF